MWAAASLDRVDVVGKVVAQDGAFSGTVPPLLPQEVSGLFDREVLLPGVMNPHDDHAVDT